MGDPSRRLETKSGNKKRKPFISNVYADSGPSPPLLFLFVNAPAKNKFFRACDFSKVDVSQSAKNAVFRRGIICARNLYRRYLNFRPVDFREPMRHNASVILKAAGNESPHGLLRETS